MVWARGTKDDISLIKYHSPMDVGGFRVQRRSTKTQQNMKYEKFRSILKGCPVLEK